MALAVSVGSSGISSAGAAATTTMPQVPKALDYVASCQRSDGGFAEKGAAASSDPLTAWTIIALASAGQDPNAWKVGGKSPVDYLSGQSAKWTTVTDYARTALAVIASGKSPRTFGGVDLIAKINAEKNGDGSIGPAVNTHIWGVLALKAFEASISQQGAWVSQPQVDWLLAQQNADGGWGWAPETASDTNDTAAALQALMACGQSSGSTGVGRGIAYLSARQKSDGGFGYSTGGTDANSTAWVIQALQATGQNMSVSPWNKGSATKPVTPVGALVALQRTGGSIRYTADLTTNPLLTTVQAIPPLSSRAFPSAVLGARSAVLFKGTPVVSLVTPTPGSTVVASTSMVLKLSLADSGTGIDPATLSAKVDGKTAKATLSGTVMSVGPVSLSKGSHSVTVSVADHAGNAVSSQKFSFKAGAVAKSAAAATVSGGTAATSPSYAGTRTAGAFKFPGPTSNDPRLSATTTRGPETTRTVMASERPSTRPGDRPAEPKKESSPIIPLAIGATSALAVVTSGTWWYLRRRKKAPTAS